MAADPDGRRAAYDDVLRALEHLVAEVSNGELFTSPRPAGPHTEARHTWLVLTRAHDATGRRALSAGASTFARCCYFAGSQVFFGLVEQLWLLNAREVMQG